MASDDNIIDITKLLFVLKKEEELIIKPFHSKAIHEIDAVECGKIVSRFNKPLFDYQIGDKANTFTINSIINQRIVLLHPETKEVVLELHHNRLPFIFKICSKKAVQCLAALPGEFQSIGSIQQRLAFAKFRYDVYNNKHEHVVSLILRKSHLRSKIQHRIVEYEILNNDKRTNIGRIYPFSTNAEGTEYGHAVAMKIPQDTKIEIKATLLINALILKFFCNRNHESSNQLKNYHYY